jgi:hypothetical protein
MDSTLEKRTMSEVSWRLGRQLNFDDRERRR